MTHENLSNFKADIILEVQKNRDEFKDIKADTLFIKWMCGILIAGILTLILR